MLLNSTNFLLELISNGSKILTSLILAQSIKKSRTKRILEKPGPVYGGKEGKTSSLDKTGFDEVKACVNFHP